MPLEREESGRSVCLNACLVANDEAKGVKVDRDVVLELNDHSANAGTPIPLPRERWETGNVRWSSAELDGQKIFSQARQQFIEESLRTALARMD